MFFKYCMNKIKVQKDILSSIFLRFYFFFQVWFNFAVYI